MGRAIDAISRYDTAFCRAAKSIHSRHVNLGEVYAENTYDKTDQRS